MRREKIFFCDFCLLLLLVFSFFLPLPPYFEHPTTQNLQDFKVAFVQVMLGFVWYVSRNCFAFATHVEVKFYHHLQSSWQYCAGPGLESSHAMPPLSHDPGVLLQLQEIPSIYYPSNWAGSSWIMTIITTLDKLSFSILCLVLFTLITFTSSVIAMSSPPKIRRDEGFMWY